MVGRQSDEFIILKAEPIRPLRKRGRREKGSERGNGESQESESEGKEVMV